MKNIRIFLVAMVGILAVGCYNDFDTPAPAKIYNQQNLEDMGLTLISIAEVKQAFIDNFGSLSNTGTNNNGWDRTKTLKLGEPSLRPDPSNPSNPPVSESSFTNIKFWEEAANYFIKGKVISSDEQGNVYKSLFIWDGTAAIELKLVSELFTRFQLNLNTKESQWVYVRLKDLYLGNYRMMLSLGDAPSDAVNAAGTHKYYANSNIDNPDRVFGNRHQGLLGIVLPGERVKLEAADIKEVNSSNYTTALGQNDFGRLVRFNDIKVRYVGTKYLDANGVTQPARPAIKNGNFTNIYPSWIVTDVNPPVTEPWYYWAYKKPDKGISLYGSVMITYNDAAEYTSDKGVYTIRTSGYSQFASRPIPKDGTVGDVLGIYGIYAQQSNYAGGANDFAQYQLSVSRLQDLDFPKMTETEEKAWIEWIEENNSTVVPPVENSFGDSE